MIISASRRTDIPAFYADWFMNRVRAGMVQVRNPFNARQVREVSLKAEDVDAVVFWTRNAAPLLPHLPDLEARDLRYLVHYTITGYPRALERAVPGVEAAVDTFRRLSGRLGPQRVIWRYDPVLLSSVTGLDDHRRLFADLARRLDGQTWRVVVSFADFYRQTARHLQGLACRDITADRPALEALAAFLADTAAGHGMAIQTCAEPDMPATLPPGKCIDDRWLGEAFGLQLPATKHKGQRPACGCIPSVDIGAYDTCAHGCVYCYATPHPERAKMAVQAQDPHRPILG